MTMRRELEAAAEEILKSGLLEYYRPQPCKLIYFLTPKKRFYYYLKLANPKIQAFLRHQGVSENRIAEALRILEN